MPILMIANPKSGRYSQKKLNKIKKILEERFGKVRIALTEYRGHAEELASKAEEDVVIAAGGDGLINETVRGIIKTDKLFYALPLGSINVFCREYGIGMNPIRAVKRMDIYSFRHIPVGYVDSNVFLTMAGFGFDAETVKNAKDMRIVNSFVVSAMAHVVMGFQALFKHKFKKIYIFMNGGKMEAYHAVIAVTACYAGSFGLGIIEKEKLNVFSISEKSVSHLLKTIIYMFLGRGFAGNKETADYVKVKGAKFCQIDGEYLEFESGSAFLRINPKAIKLIANQK